MGGPWAGSAMGALRSDRSQIECAQQVLLNVNANGWDFIVSEWAHTRIQDLVLPALSLLHPASLVIQVHHLGPAPISMPDITRCGMDVAGVINERIGDG